MLPKPAHLGPRYAAQFEDAGVASAYRFRPPYPLEFFDVLSRLYAAGPRRVLELGCGTGDVTVGLAGRADRVDAVESSAEMLAAARRREGGDDPRIRWLRGSAEVAEFDGPYSLSVAAESLHLPTAQGGLGGPTALTALRNAVRPSSRRAPPGTPDTCRRAAHLPRHSESHPNHSIGLTMRRVACSTSAANASPKPGRCWS